MKSYSIILFTMYYTQSSGCVPELQRGDMQHRYLLACKVAKIIVTARVRVQPVAVEPFVQGWQNQAQGKL